MFSSEWLDIAIGVVFIWFLLALLVSVINEGINRVFAFRARNLWRTLEQMLDNNVPKSGRWGGLIGGWAEFFHWWGRPFDPNEPPLTEPEPDPVDPCESLDPAAPPSPAAVKDAHKRHEQRRRQHLKKAQADRAEEARTCTPSRRPTTPISAGRTTARLYSTGAVQALETRTSPGQQTRISSIPTSVFAQGLIELLVQPASGGGGPVDAAVAATAIKGYIFNLHDSNPFKAELAALWTTANDDLLQFRTNIEAWFDGQMARVSRLYKKRIRIILIVVGVVVTIATFSIGVRSDALALVSDLQHDQNLREGLVGTATDATSQDLKDLGCPPDASTTTTTAASSASTPTTASDQVEQCKLKGAQKLKDFDLVFSRPVDRPRSGADVLNRLGFIVTGWHWTLWGGLVITAIALSFGATFWFDVLRRLVGIRKGSTSPS
jgi:hypothetical protein